MWLKYSNNNRGNNAYDFFKEVVDKNVTPLQVRGNKGSENILIAKHMVMLCNAQQRGCVGCKFTHDTRIERFWR